MAEIVQDGPFSPFLILFWDPVLLWAFLEKGKLYKLPADRLPLPRDLSTCHCSLFSKCAKRLVFFSLILRKPLILWFSQVGHVRSRIPSFFHHFPLFFMGFLALSSPFFLSGPPSQKKLYFAVGFLKSYQSYFHTFQSFGGWADARTECDFIF